MTLAVRNLVIQDANGNLMAGASIEVRLDVQGKPLAAIYSDRAGAVPLANPFVTDDGKASFFTVGGAYQIKATLGDFEDIQNYVPVGRGAETDISLTNPRGTWSNAVTYAKGDLVTHTGTAGMRSFISLQDTNLNHAPDADTPIVDTAWWMLSPGTTTEQAQAILDGATTQANNAAASAVTAGTQAGNALTQANAAAASAASAAASSVSPALRYTFDTGTSAAGLASGEFRGNNATLASWTTIFFNDVAVQGNVAAFLNSIFTGTSPTKGHIIGVNPQDVTKFFIFAVTGFTDQSGYTQFAGSIVASAGPFTDAWTFVLSFEKAGEPGFGDMTAANNLSDLANKKTALDNLHLIGTTVASAATTNLETATGDCVDVSGTTTITAITLSEGHERTVRFQGALTLTNGASLVLPGAANIVTAAGDMAKFRGYASGVVRCVSYSKLSGLPVIDNDLKANVEDQTITGGAAVTNKPLGTVSSGTLNIDMSDRALQSYTNNGAHTLNGDSGEGAALVIMTNGASAGAVTVTNINYQYGDAFTTTNGHNFLLNFVTIGSFKILGVKALQ
jgi:hypothetical protein